MFHNISGFYTLKPLTVSYLSFNNCECLQILSPRNLSWLRIPDVQLWIVCNHVCGITKYKYPMSAIIHNYFSVYSNTFNEYHQLSFPSGLSSTFWPQVTPLPQEAPYLCRSLRPDHGGPSQEYLKPSCLRTDIGLTNWYSSWIWVEFLPFPILLHSFFYSWWCQIS